MRISTKQGVFRNKWISRRKNVTIIMQGVLVPPTPDSFPGWMNKIRSKKIYLRM